MKEGGPPQPPPKPNSTVSSPSTNLIDDAEMDIYGGDSDDDFDLLDLDDDLPAPQQRSALGEGWVDARPPEYSERPLSPSSSRLSSPAPSNPVTTPLPPQVERHPLLINSPPNHDQSNRNPGLQSQSRLTACVICQQRPVSQEGASTCGSTCQQKLLVTTGTLFNSRAIEGPRQTAFHNSFSQNDNPQSRQLRMCEVCHVRPKCQRGVKIYPTCGLTCAAKLRPPGPVEMCDFCKKRPKAVANGRTYPQCGKTCRDNARIAVAAVAHSATCTTCILCWGAPSSGPNYDFCSPVCAATANARAPFLIELPRGHRAFKRVADIYVDGWKQTRSAIPRIKRIYMVQIKGSTVENHEQHRNRVTSPVMSRKKGNEQQAWLGIVRECGFGDPGNVEPCSSAMCQLCCIVKSHPTNEMLTSGIQTTTLLPRAVQTTRNTKNRSSKVVLLVKVLYGKVAEWSDNLPPRLPPGHDSVHLIAHTRSGTKLDFHETLVYHKDAIRPMYLVTFE